ncbi:hypothetical protein EJ05DRAFT_498333 [Pseudovirgaria hyperparasitica]|uniref:Rhodopsin domain-containing protein n=1 Tax=Pseudovirgaria hyperparasitica TaxID=470096 RepID=A0A6A6WER2_9PEZI|nr:uncharacterized protein EJ05DRAFT_498333 [Pseudovirgaria hyperparasitica]KAF2760376.1 hypothetical protein EJ05DRAFT_498333 [Pseudovirgaria hyperparasitica]
MTLDASTPDPLPPDHNVGPALIAWTSILNTLSLLTTALRLIVRRGNGVTGWDDWTILATVTVATVRSALNITGATYGYGRHRWYLTTGQQEKVNMYGFYGQVLLFITLCLLKWSICILLLRIKSTRTLKCIVYPLIAGLFLTNLLCVVVLLAECSPVATFWRPAAGSCWPAKVRINSIWLQASYSVFSDFVCSLLPIYLLHNLNMPLRTKAAVCGLMAMGLIATSCAAVRASTLTTAPTDITYAYGVTALWSNTEIHLGIVATNMSLCRAIWAYFGAALRPSVSSSNNKHMPPTSLLPGAPRGYGSDAESGGVGGGGEVGGGEGLVGKYRVWVLHARGSGVSGDGVVGEPVRTAIRRTTEVVVVEGDCEGRGGSGGHGEGVLEGYQRSWDVRPVGEREEQEERA